MLILLKTEGAIKRGLAGLWALQLVLYKRVEENIDVVQLKIESLDKRFSKKDLDFFFCETYLWKNNLPEILKFKEVLRSGISCIKQPIGISVITYSVF